MANYATLKAAINAVIKTNGNKEITGQVLNQTLMAIVDSLGENYQFAGVAVPSTNPGTPDQNIFYLATQAGTYTNFSAIVLPAGISFLEWNGSWSSETLFTIDDTPTEGSGNLVRSGGVKTAIDNIAFFTGEKVKDVGITDTLTSGSDSIITSGAVFDAFKNDGGAYDVSVHFPTGGVEGGNTYTLDGAIAMVPQNIQKGGMSIKFIQSSDNKYVQYRLMSDSFNTTVANWQGVDEEPTYGSKNLVESGGVFEKTHIIKKAELTIDATKVGYYIKTDGSAAAMSGYTYKIYDVRNISIFKIKFDTVNIGAVPLWVTYSQLDNGDISSSNVIRKKIWPYLGQPCNETIIFGQNENFIAICNANGYYDDTDVSGFTSTGIKEQVKTLQDDVEPIKDILNIDVSYVNSSIIDYTPKGNLSIDGRFYSAINSKTLPDREKDGILKSITLLTAPSTDTNFSIRLYKKNWAGGVITGFTAIQDSTYTFTFPAGETTLDVLSSNILVPKDAIIGINTVVKYGSSGNGYMISNGAFSAAYAGVFSLDVDYIVQFQDKDSARLREDEQRIAVLEEQHQESVFDAIKDANVVILGDSITWLGADDCSGRDNPSKGWTTYFKTLINPKTIHSYARSGATWSHTANTVYDITENTGSLSDDNVIYNQINRLIAAVSGGTQVTPDIIIIAAGTNDAWYPSARPNALSVDADTEFADTSGYITDMAVGTLTSIAAAMRYDIELIKTNFPNCQVIVTTPLQSTAFTLTRCFNVGKVIADCAKYLSVVCIDQASDSGIYRAQENEQYLFTYDGTHTSVLGAKLVGKFLAYEIMCNYRGTLI